MYTINSPIPQIHKDSIIRGLSAITHLVLINPSDSVFNKILSS